MELFEQDEPIDNVLDIIKQKMMKRVEESEKGYGDPILLFVCAELMFIGFGPAFNWAIIFFCCYWASTF